MNCAGRYADERRVRSDLRTDYGGDPVVMADEAGASGAYVLSMNSNADTESVTANLEGCLAGDYASNGILACNGDAPLAEIAGLMARNNVHAIVVVDDRAAEPPVVSDQDLVDAMASGHFDELTASDVAGTEAVSIFVDEDLRRAAQLLAEHRVNHLVVRNARREPVGIISTLDLAEAGSGFTRPPRDRT